MKIKRFKIPKKPARSDKYWTSARLLSDKKPKLVLFKDELGKL